MDKNKILNCDCITYMQSLPEKSVDFTLTDIPYDEVARSVGTLSHLSNLPTLGNADKATFDLSIFLNEVYRITRNMVCIFCGREQFSEIFSFFSKKPGTTRPIVWQKTNPVPVNGQFVYLSGWNLLFGGNVKEQKGLMQIAKIRYLTTQFLQGRKEFTPLKNIGIYGRNLF